MGGFLPKKTFFCNADLAISKTRKIPNQENNVEFAKTSIYSNFFNAILREINCGKRISKLAIFKVLELLDSRF